MYLRRPLLILPLAVPLAAIALAVPILAGCGGGGSPALAERTLRGQGFSYAVPADWKATRRRTEVSAAPKEKATELVSVTLFRLLHPYRPAIWPSVVGELDGVASKLAANLGGKLESSRTIRVGGLRARQYEIAYRSGGQAVVQRIAFALRARKEYQLLCRWQASAGEPEACALLFQSFKPSI